MCVCVPPPPPHRPWPQQSAALWAAETTGIHCLRPGGQTSNIEVRAGAGPGLSPWLVEVTCLVTWYSPYTAGWVQTSPSCVDAGHVGLGPTPVTSS